MEGGEITLANPFKNINPSSW